MDIPALLRLATSQADANDWDAAIATMAAVKKHLVDSATQSIGDDEVWCKYPLYLSRAGRFAEAMAEFDWLLADLPRRARLGACLDDPSVSFGKKTPKEKIYRQIIRNGKRVIEAKREVALRRQRKAESRQMKE